MTTQIWITQGKVVVLFSGIFALYPLFPTELLDADYPDEATLDIARRSAKQYTGPDPSQLAHSRPVEAFPAVVRAGHTSTSGWQPRDVLDGLDQMLSALQCCNTSMLPIATGKGSPPISIASDSCRDRTRTLFSN
jgi:hypothetical protein